MRNRLGLLLVLLGCASPAAAQTTGYMSLRPAPEPSKTTGYIAPELILTGGQSPAAADAPAQTAMALDPTGTRFWFRGEYLLWWVESDRSPVPLLTTGATTDPLPGALGQPNTSLIFDNNLHYNNTSGARFSLGWWLDDEQMFAFELSGFTLESRTIHKEANADRITGTPLEARPFFNTLTGQQNAMVITAPSSGGFTYVGGIDIFADSRTWGGEVNFWTTLMQQPDAALRIVTGFRYLGQKDQIRIDQSTTPLYAIGVTNDKFFFGGDPVDSGNVVSVRDFYETLNHFYGGQIGAKYSVQRNRWLLDVTGKAGLGVTDQQLNTVGFTKLWFVRTTNEVKELPGGLYLLPGNIGTIRRQQFSFAGEADFRLSYLLGERWRAQLGYTFLYWSSVVRPGEQINANLDPRLIPSNPAYNPAAAPQAAPVFQTSDFWAQGLTFGFEFQY